MTKSKRNLLVSILVLVLTVAIAGGSTYAWFTTNEKVTVADMDVNVTTGSKGLYISADPAKGYKTYLNAEDLIVAGFVKENIKMDAITSPDGSSFKGKAVDSTASDKNSYIEIKVYFRATSESNTVAPIVDLSTFNIQQGNDTPRIFYNGLQNPIDPTAYGKVGAASIPVGGEITADAVHAARVSFQATAGAGNSGPVRVCDPYKGFEGSYRGSPKAGTVEGAATANDYDNSVEAGNLAYYYYNNSGNEVLAGIPTLATTEVSSVFTKNVLNFTYNATTVSWEGNLVVRVWLEGYDGDCLNSILGESLKVVLAFTVA